MKSTKPTRYKSQNYGVIVLNGIAPGEGGGEVPGPNTVGTEQIVDDSIEMEDLSHNVKDKMLTGDNRVTQEELDQFEV